MEGTANRLPRQEEACRPRMIRFHSPADEGDNAEQAISRKFQNIARHEGETVGQGYRHFRVDFDNRIINGAWNRTRQPARPLR